MQKFLRSVAVFWLIVFSIQSVWAMSGEILTVTGSLILNETGTGSGEVFLNANGSGEIILPENGTGEIVLPENTTGGTVLDSSGATIETAEETAESGLKINEFLPNPLTGKEWVEFYNTAGTGFDLSGFSLWDAVKTRYTFPTNTFLPPDGFLSIEFSNVFNNDTDQLYLKNTLNETVDYFSYGATHDLWQNIPKGSSVGRAPDGSADWLIFPAEQITRDQNNFSYYKQKMPFVSAQTSSGGLIDFAWDTVDFPDFGFYRIYQNTGSGFVILTETTENHFQINGIQAGEIAEFLFLICDQSGHCSSDIDGQKIPVTAFLNLRLNEFSANASGKDDNLEWIELFYAGSGVLALNGFLLEIDGTKTLDLNGLEIMDYLLINPADFGVTLKNTNGKIALRKSGINSVWEEFNYAEARENFSWRRNLITNVWEEATRPTPGEANIFWNTAPSALLKIQGSGKTSGHGSLSFNVTAEDSFDPDGDTFNCFWDFGDGSFVYKCNPGAHQYGAGEFDLKLTVYDDFGGTDFKTQHISVLPHNSETTEKAIAVPVFDPAQKFSNDIKITAFLPDPEGKDSELEWIELTNFGKTKVVLDWWWLDDAEGGSKPSLIPPNTVLEAGKSQRFLVTETKLALNNDGDTVRLFDPNLSLKDSVTYAKAPAGGIYQLDEVGVWDWSTVIKETLAEEVFVPQVFDFSLIEISEILPSSSAGDSENEWIELYNRGSETYDLAGWRLDDVLTGGSKPYVLPPHSQIEPHGFLLIYSRDSGLALNNDGDTVHLITPAGKAQDFFQYAKTAKNCSWARNGKGRFVFSALMTPGAKNLIQPKITQKDQDKDGLSDFDELNFYQTDWQKKDTDGDGVPDGFEVYNGLDPLARDSGEIYADFLTRKIKTELNQTDQQKMLLQGTAEPDALVKLYIHSKLTVAMVRADSAGNWEYAIQDTLEAGQHKVETEVWLDTGFKTAKKTTLEFQLAQDYKVPEISTRLKINAVLPNGEGDDKKTEYFVLRNFDNRPVNLQGWQIMNQKKQSFVFQLLWLQPGEERKFFYADTKISLNNTAGYLTLLNSQGKRTDFLSYADVSEGEIFTHQGSQKQTKKVNLTLPKEEDYEIFTEIRGIVQTEINAQDLSFQFKDETGREILVQFDATKFPITISRLFFETGNELLLKGNFSAENIFQLEDFILLKQANRFGMIASLDAWMGTISWLWGMFFLFFFIWFFIRKKLHLIFFQCEK